MGLNEGKSTALDKEDYEGVVSYIYLSKHR